MSKFSALLFFGTSLKRLFSPFAVAALGVASGLASGISIADEAVASENPEDVLLQALEDWRSGDRDSAERRVDSLTDSEPDFRLAQMLRGDLLSSRAGDLPMLADSAAESTNDKVMALLGEARTRLTGSRAATDGALPGHFLELADSVENAILVDLQDGRLYLYENQENGPRLVADYYASIGSGGPHKRREGDKRTPVGVYFVTSYIDGSELPDLYGLGAFPVNYPNNWDKRQGFTGSGIWLHGVPSDTYSRPPRSSRGCVTMANADLASLSEHISIGRTPVVMADGVDWVEADEVAATRSEVKAAIAAWEADWESLDAERYLRHYADDFNANGKNLKIWSTHKRLVNAKKEYIRIALTEVSLFSYPGADVVVADFRQRYESSNYNGTARKRQYWRNDDGSWKIVWEGAP